MNAEIRATYGRMRNSSKLDEVRKVMEMLSNLKLNLGENDSLRASVDETSEGQRRRTVLRCRDNDDVREASISNIADDMEQLAIATPLEMLRTMNAKAKLTKLRRRLLHLRSCRLCSVQFWNRHFYVTYWMRVLTFRELLIYLEKTQTQRCSCSLLKCFRDVPSLSDNTIR